MAELLLNLRFALRMMRKTPGFAVVAILTIALGIGANSAIFSVVNSVLLRPLPYRDSERIVRIWNALPSRGLNQIPTSEPEFLEFRQSQSFDHVGAFASGAQNLTGAGRPERVTTAWTSYDVFSVLDVQAMPGRVFSADEDQHGKNQVVVLSHRLWQNHFGADPNIIGKSVTLNRESKTVIGIMPPSFKFPSEDVDVWAPLAIDPASRNLGMHYLGVIGHLRPGATVEQAQAEMKTVFDRMAQRYPDYYKGASGLTVSLVPLRELIVGDVRPALLVLLGAVGFMLLICCANVANLLLARAAGRKKEIATRTALGASRLRIAYQLLTESLLISLLGGIVGVLLALWGIKTLVSGSFFEFPQMQEIAIDSRVLLFTAFTSVVTGILFGLAPVLQTAKPNLSDALKQGGRSGAEGKGSKRTRSSLVISELAFSLVLLAGAGLMIGSFLRLLEVKLGFDPENVLTMQMSLPQSQYPELRQASAFYRELVDRVDAQPGVKSAAVVNYLPMTEQNATASLEAEGRTLDSAGAIADYRVISKDYFHTMGVSVIQGRAFTDADAKQVAVIINETMARKFWPGEDAIGKRIRLKADAPWLPVVGVVTDIKNHGLSTETKPEMYFPHTDQPFGLWADFRSMTLVVRCSSDPLQMASAVRAQIQGLDKDLPVYKVQTMDRIIAESISQTRFTMALLSFFGVLALILAAIGVYGVMSYSVAQRTHEVGIRKALGAKPREIVALFVRQGLALALLGVGIGLATAFALTRLMSKLLYGVAAADPLTFISVAFLLTMAALLACYLPARRASKVDPMVALRYE